MTELDLAHTPNTVLDENSHIGFRKWLEDRHSIVVVYHDRVKNSLAYHCALAEWLTHVEGEPIVVSSNSYRLRSSFNKVVNNTARRYLPLWAGRFIQFFGVPESDMTGGDCLLILDRALAQVEVDRGQT